jgi:hypothetical protein
MEASSLKGQDTVVAGYGAQGPEYPPGDLVRSQFADFFVTVEHLEYTVQNHLRG